MGRSWLMATILLAGAFCSTGALADPSLRDVQSLLSDCTSAQGDPSYFLCIGYVAGIGDQMMVNGALFSKGDDRSRYIKFLAICPKDSPSRGIEIQTFVKWAQRHPERWRDNSIDGVIDANREAWPCR